MTPSLDAPLAFVLRLDPRLSRALDERAARLGQTRSGLTRELLRVALAATETASPSDFAMAKSLPAPFPRFAMANPDGPVKSVHIRLNAEEFSAAQARAHGWRSVGAWCRALVRFELGSGVVPLSDEDRVLLSSSIRELRRLGINLNQIAHRLNSDVRYQTSSGDVGTIAEVLDAIEAHIAQATRTFSGGAS